MTYLDAIDRLVAGLDDDVVWAVTASANLALRGFPVEPGDVDVLTDEAGARRILDGFDENATRTLTPPTSVREGESGRTTANCLFAGPRSTSWATYNSGIPTAGRASGARSSVPVSANSSPSMGSGFRSCHSPTNNGVTLRSDGTKNSDFWQRRDFSWIDLGRSLVTDHDARTTHVRVGRLSKRLDPFAESEAIGEVIPGPRRGVPVESNRCRVGPVIESLASFELAVHADEMSAGMVHGGPVRDATWNLQVLDDLVGIVREKPVDLVRRFVFIDEGRRRFGRQILGIRRIRSRPSWRRSSAV
jgi:hypothetical protein